MTMKNKLYHHHKSKFSIVMRNFSLSVVGVFAFVAAISVPTYISIQSTHQSVKAEGEPTDENSDDLEGLESYEDQQ